MCFRYGRWVTRKVAVASIATVWILAALISFVPISLGLHRPAQPLVYSVGSQVKYTFVALCQQAENLGETFDDPN